MACSVTEARTHDESRGGRSVTGVYRSVMGGTELKCNWGMEVQQASEEV